MTAIGFENTSVLITGGTRGLGKAIGLEFACAGAKVFLTHHWGSADEDAIRTEFRAAGAVPPTIVEADVADPAATRELMRTIQLEAGRLDVFVSNVAFSKVIKNIDDLKKSTFELSLGYSAWPLVDYVQASREVCGKFPRYVIAVSSSGGEVCYDGYDFAGASKAVLETLCRYLALRLKPEGVRVNAIRPGFLDTASSRATFGDAAIDTLDKNVKGMFLPLDTVARVCLALCSGLMDAVNGQVITVDEGWSLLSPAAFITGQGLPGAFPDREPAT